MYRLYTIPGSCSTGIHALLNELQLPVEIVNRDDVADFTALVATNQVPALLDTKVPDNQPVTEGANIVLQLLQQHGDAALIADGEFLQWLMFNYATLHPAYSKLFTVNGVMDDGEAKQALMQTLADKTAELWQIVDRRLAGRRALVGEQLGVLDYLLAIYVRWGNAFPEVTLPVGDNVLALVARVVEEPAFIKAFEREEVAYNIPDNAL